MAELLAAYNGGALISQLADQFTVRRGTVMNILKREGAPSRRGVIDRQIDEARKLYENGWSLVRLGHHFSVDPDTARRALLKAGVTLRKPWERP